MSDEPADTCSRRAALRLALAAPAFAALAGCRSEPGPPPGTLVELADLPEGERVVVMHGEEPVELLRTGRNVRARSLWCTHMGCRVRWEPRSEVYVCPCHEGRFDADGRVIGGPPPRPLRSIPNVLRGSGVVLLDPGVPRSAG